METGSIILLLVVAIVCLLIGMIIGRVSTERRYVRDTRYTKGTLNVDCSDQTRQPILFLASGVPVEDIVSQKYISLDVCVIRPNSHE